MQLSRLYFETVLKYAKEHDTVFLPAPLLMYARRNERPLRDNHLVKRIHYTGEKKKTICLLLFWRCLLQTCYHSVLYHSSYSAVVQISNLLSNLRSLFKPLARRRALLQHIHLSFKFKTCFSPSLPAFRVIFPTCDGSIF